MARLYDAADHVLREYAADLPGADASLAPQAPGRLGEVLDLVPDRWLVDSGFDSPEAGRQAYREHLTARAERSAAWLPGVAAA